MSKRHLLVLSNRSDPKELDPLKQHIAAEIDHLSINRDYKNINLPIVIDGIFFCNDIDAGDIGTITRLFKLEVPMARVLPQIYEPVNIDKVKTCENTEKAIEHFIDCFKNN